jgi:hypothetical protein
MRNSDKRGLSIAFQGLEETREGILYLNSSIVSCQLALHRDMQVGDV